MSIQIEYTTDSGITLRSAYARIDTISGGIGGMAAGIAIYRDEAARRAGLALVGVASVEFAPDPDVPLWAQAYDAVKEAYPGAVDC